MGISLMVMAGDERRASIEKYARVDYKRVVAPNTLESFIRDFVPIYINCGAASLVSS